MDSASAIASFHNTSYFIIFLSFSLDKILDMLYNFSIMSELEYRDTLRAAREEFANLLAKKRTIDERLVKLSKTIESLQNLLNEKGSKAVASLKFADACRYTLRGSRTPKTPMEIREDLVGIGFPIEQYENVLASIHTTLKRLLDRGEVESVAVSGKTAYVATNNLKSVAGLELYW